VADPQPPLPLFDAHAHLYDKAFETDLEEVLNRAARKGVLAVLTVSETLAEAQQILCLAERYPMIKPCAGLYPTILDVETADDMMDFIRKHREELVAIGEVGLDYWRVKDHAGREIQRENLSRHVSLAKELDLPLNVHSRSAGRHAIALLLEQGARRVLMHAFDGKASSAMAGVEAGYYFSIPPSIVRSPQKQRLIKSLSLERLLLESDAPVLAPSKEERNEPQNVWLASVQIASIKGLTVEEVAEVTTENARLLFPKAFE
jgi:TatD DNase family protein